MNNGAAAINLIAKKPLIAGIVNATGDSFSEENLSLPDSAVERAIRLLDDGADIIDIGGESTRPGASEVYYAKECERVLHIIERILRLRPNTVLSLDTRHSFTAKMALELGVAIINDVSMLRFDNLMASVVSEFNAVLILCHSRGIPATMQNDEYLYYHNGVVSDVKRELSAAASLAENCGVKHMWFDPGLGFAKTSDQNKKLMLNVDEFKRLGPVFIGASRKSFIGTWTGEKIPAARLGGTLAAELFLIDHGADIVRTHDVKNLRQALDVRRELNGI